MIKLYIVHPLMTEGNKVPKLHVGEFKETGKQYTREAPSASSNDSAFAWSRRISRSIVALGQKLTLGGFPALTAELAVQRWEKYLRQQHKRHMDEVRKIEEELQKVDQVYKMEEALLRCERGILR